MGIRVILEHLTDSVSPELKGASQSLIRVITSTAPRGPATAMDHTREISPLCFAILAWSPYTVSNGKVCRLERPET